ncbi:uncharacterized protein LAESUDRAFT_754816 [Laetiporus sulphureus 93-53]|uniref:Uncharacterized protein n=1 Tax=Laetiporus sulphureus 93-53 TaxID=1314785 RepID=A0A165H1R5_9APHY|nr:uncharacterized protein LAESUDRAFT_754816 [Laetiporus sulphureus 93-53]KZT11123.1 hypothetical protein LAESUDRAFT_754816 [Laetiporus sulphureus 93-53]
MPANANEMSIPMQSYAPVRDGGARSHFSDNKLLQRITFSEPSRTSGGVPLRNLGLPQFHPEPQVAGALSAPFDKPGVVESAIRVYVQWPGYEEHVFEAISLFRRERDFRPITRQELAVEVAALVKRHIDTLKYADPATSPSAAYARYALENLHSAPGERLTEKHLRLTGLRYQTEDVFVPEIVVWHDGEGQPCVFDAFRLEGSQED